MEILVSLKIGIIKRNQIKNCKVEKYNDCKEHFIKVIQE